MAALLGYGPPAEARTTIPAAGFTRFALPSGQWPWDLSDFALLPSGAGHREPVLDGPRHLWARALTAMVRQ